MIEGGAMAVRGWHMAEPAYAVVAKGANARCGMLYSSMYLHIHIDANASVQRTTLAVAVAAQLKGRWWSTVGGRRGGEGARRDRTSA